MLFVCVSHYCHYYASLPSCLRGLFFFCFHLHGVRSPHSNLHLLHSSSSAHCFSPSLLCEFASHPGQSAVRFILDGLRNGFRLDFNQFRRLKSAKKNKPSANQNAEVVDRYLANEVSLGRVLGPLPSPPLPNLHMTNFGVIPKRGQPGKWRLIVDLSSPGGLSINDGINPENFSLKYITVDQIISMVSKLGRGILRTKFDLEATYGNIPRHP